MMKWICIALLALFSVQEEEAAKLAPHVREYATKFKLVGMGIPAIAPLMLQIEDENEWLAFESRSALRWIVNYSLEDAQESAEVNRLFVAYAGPEHSLGIRKFAAEMLGDLGQYRALKTLGDMLGEEDLRQAALDSLRRIPNEGAWHVIWRAVGRTDGDFKLDLIQALGERQNPMATGALLRMARGEEPAVVRAAVRALGACGDFKGAEVLGELARTQVPGASAALLQLGEGLQGDKRRECLRLAWENYENFPIKFRAQEGLARMGWTAMQTTLQQDTKNPDEEIREQAWSSLVYLADHLAQPEAIPIFLGVLKASQRDGTLIRAMVGCTRFDEATLAPPVAAFLESDRAALRTTAVTALRDIPGPEAAAFLMTLGHSLNEDVALRNMAIDALGSKSDPAVAGLLRDWIDGGAAQPDRPRALNAYLKIAGRAEGQRSRDMFHFALGHGATDAALKGLGRVGDSTSLEPIRNLIEGAAEFDSSQCLETILSIGDRLVAKGNREGALAAYRLAVDAGGAVQNKLRLLGEPVEIISRGGRIDAWWVIGPFPAPDTESWGRQEFPETEIDLNKTYSIEDREVGWLPVQSQDGDAIVDLNSLFTPNERVTAYAFAEVHVKKAQDVALFTGSDDGITVWVNGEEVYRKWVPRGLTPDDDAFLATLQEGRNTILLKVHEISGGWNYCARIENNRGRPLKFRIR